MSSTFFGLQIALSGLRSQRLAMEIAGHNVANASTPGYTRQRVLFTPGIPYTITGMSGPAGPLMKGSGVQAREITRVADIFVDAQLREQKGLLAEKEQRSMTVSQVEGVFSEPGEQGLGAMLAAFWNAWEELTLNPESLATRRSLVYQSQSLVQTFRRMADELSSIQANLDFEVEQNAGRINEITVAVANLNAQIARARAGGANPNDLVDEREVLVGELRTYIDVRVRLDNDGRMSVFSGNRALVLGNDASRVAVDIDPTSGFHRLVWESDSEPLKIEGGRIFSLIDARDVYIKELLADLDTLALGIMQAVNLQHAAGYDLDGNAVMGTPFQDFFTGSGAGDMQVNPSLVSDPRGIAASAGSGPGDAENARLIALLREAKIMGGTYTCEDYYRGLVARVGIDAQAMEKDAENTKILTEQIERWRQSVSGVSLDEEMVRLIEAQHAFQAASRAITVMDSALETIINRMGVVGR